MTSPGASWGCPCLPGLFPDAASLLLLHSPGGFAQGGAPCDLQSNASGLTVATRHSMTGHWSDVALWWRWPWVCFLLPSLLSGRGLEPAQLVREPAPDPGGAAPGLPRQGCPGPGPLLPWSAWAPQEGRWQTDASSSSPATRAPAVTSTWACERPEEGSRGAGAATRLGDASRRTARPFPHRPPGDGGRCQAAPLGLTVAPQEEGWTVRWGPPGSPWWPPHVHVWGQHPQRLCSVASLGTSRGPRWSGGGN